MEMYKSEKARNVSLHVALATFLSFSSVGFSADNDNSDQLTDADDKECRRIISRDKTSVVLKNCNEADVDLTTDDGSRIRIKSKGKSNSIVVNIGKD